MHEILVEMSASVVGIEVETMLVALMRNGNGPTNCAASFRCQRSGIASCGCSGLYLQAPSKINALVLVRKISEKQYGRRDQLLED